MQWHVEPRRLRDPSGSEMKEMKKLFRVIFPVMLFPNENPADSATDAWMMKHETFTKPPKEI